MDVEVLTIATLQKEKREKKIKDSASTMDTEGKFLLSTEMEQIDVNLLGQDRQWVNSDTRRGKNKVATMLKNRKEKKW